MVVLPADITSGGTYLSQDCQKQLRLAHYWLPQFRYKHCEDNIGHVFGTFRSAGLYHIYSCNYVCCESKKVFTLKACEYFETLFES